MDNAVSDPSAIKVLADSLIYVILIFAITVSINEVTPNLQDGNQFTQWSS